MHAGMTDFGLAIHFTLQAARYECLAIQNFGIGWNFRAEATVNLTAESSRCLIY
jgi:hypothetical protein